MEMKHLAVFLALFLLVVDVRTIKGDSLNGTDLLQAKAPPPSPENPQQGKQKTGRSGDVTYTASYSVVRSALRRGKTMMVTSVPVPNKPSPVHVAQNAKEDS